MHCSLLLASLATIAIALPLDMNMKSSATNDMKAEDYTNYAAYGRYGDYSDYDAYLPDVEEAAKAMAKASVKRHNMDMNEMMNNPAVREMMRKESMMLGAAADVGGVEMAKRDMMKDMMMNDAMMKDMMMKDAMMKDMMMKDAKQAGDTSYGKYGAYGKYTTYGEYPGAVEEAKVNEGVIV